MGFFEGGHQDRSWPRVSGVRPRPKPHQGSPLAPRTGPKPWRFAAWRIRNLRPFSRPSAFPWAEAREIASGRILGRSLGSAWRSMSRSSGSAGFAAPGSKPGPARPFGAEAPGAGGSAPARRHRFLPGWSWIRRSGVRPVRSAGPKAFGPVPVPFASEDDPGSEGRLTKPAALAFAEGQARPRPLRCGFVSRPAVRFHRSPVRRRDQASAWAVAGKAFPRCREIVSATS